MKANNPTVTIGIPAHNEEKNIGHLLHRLIRQKQSTYTLQKIIVVNDKSSDRTKEIVQTIHDRRILLLNNRTRKGQAHSQNRIFASAHSDILIVLEGDTLPANLGWISQIIDPIKRNRNIALVQGNTGFVYSHSLIGKVIETQESMYKRHAMLYKNPADVFCTGRGGRAYTRIVYSQLLWPDSVPEDTYAVMWCKTNHVQTAWSKRAICLYKPAQTFREFLRERHKAIQGRIVMQQFADYHEIRNIYQRPKSEEILIMLRFLFTNPLFFVLYTYMNLFSRIFSPPSDFSSFWITNRSTKLLLVR